MGLTEGASGVQRERALCAWRVRVSAVSELAGPCRNACVSMFRRVSASFILMGGGASKGGAAAALKAAGKEADEGHREQAMQIFDEIDKAPNRSATHRALLPPPFAPSLVALLSLCAVRRVVGRRAGQERHPLAHGAV